MTLRDPEKLRYTTAPLPGRPQLPGDDGERRERWRLLLADKNKLITSLRAQNAQLRLENAGLRDQLAAAKGRTA